MSFARHLVSPTAWVAMGIIAALGLTACGPSDPLAAARQLQDRGEFEASLEPLRELLAQRPDDPEIQYRYGAALAQIGEFSMAQWALMRAMEDPEWSSIAALGLAELSLRTTDWNQAVQALDTVLATDPENVDALVLRTKALLSLRTRYEEALQDADRVLELDPENLDILAFRFVALLGLNQNEEGEEALETLVEQFREQEVSDNQSAYFCAALALFAVENKQPELAETRYESCLEDFPDDDTVVPMAIDFFDRIDRKDRSLEILRVIVDAKPRANSYRSQLAARLDELGQREEALALLHEATEVEEPTLAAGAWLDVGYFHVETENFSAAADAAQKALDLAPNPGPQLLAYAADGFLLADRYEEALRVADAMTVPVHQALVRGRVALAQGRPENAMSFFEQGLELWPDNAVARYFAARSAEQLGDFDRAIEEYRYALRANAASTDAKTRLARILRAQGNENGLIRTVRHANSPETLKTTGPEPYLIAAELLARQDRLKEANQLLLPLIADPESRGDSLAALARGVAVREGPEGAIVFIGSLRNIDLTAPGNSALLREMTDFLAASGKPDEALATARNAVKAHPETAPFQTVYGLALERAEAPDEEIRSRFEQALELDPASQDARYGLARLDARGGNLEAALARFQNADATDPREAILDRALWLEQSGQSEEAMQLLADYLRELPADGAAALRLAKLRLKYASDREGAAKLARQAERFGSDPEAKALADELAPPGAQSPPATQP